MTEVYIVGRIMGKPPVLIGPFDNPGTAEGFATAWRDRTPLAATADVVELTDPLALDEKWDRTDGPR